MYDAEIIPTFKPKILASGRISKNKIPVGEASEMYQDYVASVALRLAGDLFNILPLDLLYVTCVVNRLDTRTGHTGLSPVLSVEFKRDTFQHLRLSDVDPSESMENFEHKMNFRKTKGLEPIIPLKEIN